VVEKKLYSLIPLCQAAEEFALEGRPAAIGAFNVNFYSQATGILKGLRKAEAPAIIQASRGANKFQGGPDRIAGMILRAMEELNHDLPVCLHLDHGTAEAAKQCIEGGFSSVMIDASDLELFENEYGSLAGVEEDIEHEETTYANPLLVPFILDESRADALAIAYGTSHGPNKGKNISAVDVSIVQRSYDGLKAYGMNMNKFLVGHGSSTVPKELVAEINRYGGEIKEAYGVPMSKIKEGIAAGLRKMNIDTDLRLGITAVFRKYLFDNPGIEDKFPETLGRIKKAFAGEIEMMAKGKVQDPKTVIDPRGYLGVIDIELLRTPPTPESGLQEVMTLVEERIASHVAMLVEEFDSAGLAPKIK
jgi:fructose-bisphosphate aldolase class II